MKKSSASKVSRKALSVFMSVVLAVGLMPLPAYAELAPGSAGDDSQALVPGAADLSAQAVSAGVADEADAMHVATPSLSTQAGDGGTYEDPSGWSLNYVSGYDGEDLGLIVVHMRGNGGSYDAVIPSEIHDDALGTLPVIGLGADYEGGFTWFNSTNFKTITIPNSVRSLHNIYFDGGGADGVTFQSGSPVTKLYPGVFKYYKAASISLPQHLEEIYDEMFVGSRIESLDVPASVKRIGDHAFHDCRSLTSITLHEGLETIDREAFSHVPHDGYYRGEWAQLTEIALPNSLKSIGEHAFGKMLTLSNVSFGTSAQDSELTVIGDRAFYGVNVKSVVIPNSVESIGSQAFTGRNGVSGYGGDGYEGEHVLSSVQFGSSQEASQLKMLYPKAFAEQPLKSIELPDSLTALTSDNTDFKYNGMGFIVPKESGDGETTLLGFDHKGNLLRTGGAFTHCDQLASIAWPAGLRVVGGFDYCTSLTDESVNNLPASASVIDEYAFYSCTGLKSVTIPATVTRIGKGAFGMNSDVAISGVAPTYTIVNPTTEIEYVENASFGPQGPWPVGRGYTICYPASAGADSGIVKYKDAVQAYEQEKGSHTYNYQYTQFIAMNDVQHGITGAIPEGATARLFVNGLEEATFDTASISAKAGEDKVVAVVVSMDGYADYTVMPNAGTENEGKLTDDFEFTVKEADLTPLEDTGSMYVTVSKTCRPAEEQFGAAIGCHAVVFDSAGRLVFQGVTSTSHTVLAEGLLPGTYTVVAFDKNDWFSGVSSVADFERLGVQAGTWAQGEAVVEKGKTTELVLDVPDLKANAAEILESGGVSIGAKRIVPGLEFNVRLTYTMKEGREANKVLVNIPEGMVPTGASTTKHSYGISGYNSADHTLTINLQSGDTQSSTLYVSCKVDANKPGLYNVSASVFSGAASAPLGSSDVNASGLQLIVPTYELTDPTFTVDVYAAPGATVRFKAGDTPLEAKCVTNRIGHGTATVTLQGDALDTASYLGELDVTAYVLGEGDSVAASDTQNILVHIGAESGEPSRDYELSFKHAGQEVFLVKDGKARPGVRYNLINPTHYLGTYTPTWPFTYVVDSDQELEDTALLALKMLDGSVRTEDMQLQETRNLGRGVVRYTYKAEVPFGDGNERHNYKLSDIPYGFEGIPSYADVEPLARALTQDEIDAIKTTVPTTEGQWATWARGIEERVLVLAGYSYENRDAFYYRFAYTPEEYNALPAAEKPHVDDSLPLIFNNAYHHENWEDPSLWNSMNAEMRQYVLEYEQAMDDLCKVWQEAYQTTRPLNEYENLQQYMTENLEYDGDYQADPAALKALGYTVVYDQHAAADEPTWHAISFTPPDDEELLEGQSVDSDSAVMSTQANEKGKKSEIKVANQKGVKVAKKILKKGVSNVASGLNIASQTTSAAGVGVSKMADVAGAAAASAQAGSAEARIAAAELKTAEKFSTSLSVVGAGLTIWSLWQTWSDDGVLILTRLDTISKMEKDIAERERKLKETHPNWETTRCYRVLQKEKERVRNFKLGTYAWEAQMVGDSVVEAEIAAVSCWPGLGFGVSAGLAGAGAAVGTGAAFWSPTMREVNNELKRLAENMHKWREHICDQAPDPRYKANVGIDPSGFVFEGTEDNLLSGVTATIFEWADGDWVEWKADEWEQVNNQVTGETGYFGWDVPVGKWKVVFSKEGYESAVIDLGEGYVASATAETPTLTVLPEWKNIGVGLLSAKAPAVVDAALNDYVATFTFDQLMKQSVAPTVTVNGAAATYEWVDSKLGLNEQGTREAMSKTLRVTLPESARQKGGVQKVAVSGGVGYAGKTMASAQSEWTLPDMRTDLAGASIADIANQTYTSYPLAPEVSVTLNGEKLIKDKDYTVEYSGNTEVGEATATITGQGWYFGTVEKTFKIEHRDPTTMFSDLDANGWYLETKPGSGSFAGAPSTLYLDYILARGIMSGYSGTNKFGPDDSVSRAQVAVILYRADQNKTAETTDNKVKPVFVDCGYDEYYSRAVQWAYENKIVTGYTDGSNRFGPNDPVTREQLATMIHRFAVQYRHTQDASKDLGYYVDAGTVSPYAVAAMRYNVAIGAMGAGGNRLNPQDGASRVQTAKIVAVVLHDVVGM